MFGGLAPVGAAQDNGYRFPIKNPLLHPVSIASVALMGLTIAYYVTECSQHPELCPSGRSFQRVLISSESPLAAIAFCGLLCYASYVYSKQQHRALQHQVNDLSNRVEDLSKAVERLATQPANHPHVVEQPELPADELHEEPAAAAAVQADDPRVAEQSEELSAAAADSGAKLRRRDSCEHCVAPSISGDEL